MRAIFIKAVINSEMDFDRLTNDEQIEMISELIKLHNISYPDDKKIFMVVEPCLDIDRSLDF